MKEKRTDRHGPKTYAWAAAIGLLCLFIGLFLGIKILAMKGSEVFEGVAAPPAKIFWSQVFAVAFIALSIALGAFVARALRSSRRNDLP